MFIETSIDVEKSKVVSKSTKIVALEEMQQNMSFQFSFRGEGGDCLLHQGL